MNVLEMMEEIKNYFPEVKRKDNYTIMISETVALQESNDVRDIVMNDGAWLLVNGKRVKKVYKENMIAEICNVS